MTQQDSVTFEVDASGVGLVTFDQPGRAMNVLTPELLGRFATLLERLEQEEGLKGLVLTSGKSSFIAGADIDQLSQITTVEQAFELGEELKALLRRMEKCGKPVVAALNGTTLGGGLELALACHARFAIDDPKAKIGLPEVKLGLLPGAGGTQRLPRAISKAKAMDLVLTSRMMDAAEAERAGLVSRVVPAAELLDVVLAAAQTICEFSGPSVMMAKECVNRAYEGALADGVMFERRLFHSLFATDDQKEGMAAFVEKRKPAFKQR